MSTASVNVPPTSTPITCPIRCPLISAPVRARRRSAGAAPPSRRTHDRSLFVTDVEITTPVSDVNVRGRAPPPAPGCRSAGKAAPGRKRRRFCASPRRLAEKAMASDGTRGGESIPALPHEDSHPSSDGIHAGLYSPLICELIPKTYGTDGLGQENPNQGLARKHGGAPLPAAYAGVGRRPLRTAS